MNKDEFHNYILAELSDSWEKAEHEIILLYPLDKPMDSYFYDDTDWAEAITLLNEIVNRQNAMLELIKVLMSK